MSMIAFSPAVGPIRVNVIIDEDHTSEIEITGNPIETGAEVHDHAYLLPKEVSLKVVSREAVETFAAFRRLQASRVPFTLVTGLSVYRNMLVRRINPKRNNAEASNVFYGTIDLQEIIIVGTAYATSEIGDETSEGTGNTLMRQARPMPEISGDSATADRATGIVARGDSPTITLDPTTAVNRAIIASVF